ncbi:MAG: hypothetical protein PHT07_15395 [Paludibacter sp.]|nr:hypothetical protein [Paludibacter sp.]
MAKTTEGIREPGENATENVTGNIVDPIIAANPSNKDYSKYNATIHTDIPGEMPDIPEPMQQPIDVDFTTKSEDPIFPDDDSGPGSGGIGGGGGSRSEIDHEEPEEPEGTKVDLTQSQKMLIARAATNIGINFLGKANEFIIDRWMITEKHVTNRILEGKADPDVLDFKINIGSTVIDMRQLLTSSRSIVEKGFEFTKEEQKEIAALIAAILKEKNIEMSPEAMLVAMIAQKYTLGSIEMYKTKEEVENLLNRVNELIRINKENHNIHGQGVTIEPSEKPPAAAAGATQTKTKATSPKNNKGSNKRPVADKQSTDDGDISDDKAGAPVADIREPGEVRQPRRQKRTVDKDEMRKMVQDVEFVPVK